MAFALGTAVFLPPFATHGLNATGALSATGLSKGLLMASFPLAALLGYVFAGPLSDRHGRGRVLSIGILGFAFSHLLLMLCRPLGQALDLSDSAAFLMLRLMAGVFGGMIFVVANALAGDVFPARRRARAMSIVWLGIPAALVVGVPLTSYLDRWHNQRSAGFQYWVSEPYAPLALVVSLVSLFLVRRMGGAFHAAASRATDIPERASTKPVWIGAPVISFLMPFAVLQLLATVADHVKGEFHWSELTIGHLFLVLGLSGVAGGVLSGVYADACGKLRFLLVAQILFAAMLWILPWATPMQFWLVSGLLSLFSAMRQGPFQALALSATGRSARGAFSSVVLGAGAIGTAAGQIAGSALFDTDPGFKAIAWSSAGATLLAALLSAAVLKEPGVTLACPSVPEGERAQEKSVT